MTTRFGRREVRLFRFAHQARTWYFAQAERTIDAGGALYLPAPIERDEIRQTAESAKDKLNIRLGYLCDPNAPASAIPATQTLGDLWRPYIPTGVVTVMCLDHEYGSADLPKVRWMGVVAQPAFTDVQLELTCLPGAAIAKSVNQGPKWQKACWKEPYSQGIRGCGMVQADYETTGTLTAVDGFVLTADEFALANLVKPLSLLGGEARWTDSNGQVHRRMIVSHADSAIRLHFGGPELAPGLSVTVRSNCPQTWDGCAARWPDPQLHYGGGIYRPVEATDGVSMTWR